MSPTSNLYTTTKWKRCISSHRRRYHRNPFRTKPKKLPHFVPSRSQPQNEIRALAPTMASISKYNRRIIRGTSLRPRPSSTRGDRACLQLCECTVRGCGRTGQERHERVRGRRLLIRPPSEKAAAADMRNFCSDAFCLLLRLSPCRRNVLQNASEKEPGAAKNVDIARLGASGPPTMLKSVKAARPRTGYVNCRLKSYQVQMQPS